MTPALLDDILGQDRAVETLRAAIASGRVHHAWIFAGPEGVGKRTAAMAFAAALLDPTTGPDLAGRVNPDPDSKTQHLIAADAHPDLHVITKELAAYADDARVRNQKHITIAKDVIDARLLGPIKLAPSIRADSLASKVFIVDEAELLDRSPTNAPVQNALLKTLEEPPAGSVLILVTSREDRLLATVRSRCQRVAFGLVDDASMRAWLGEHHPELKEAEAEAVLRFASGSPGLARVAAETGIHTWADRLEPMLADAERGVFPLELGPTMAELIDSWAAERVAAGEKAGAKPSKDAANRAAARHLFRLLSERARGAVRNAAQRGERDAVDRAARALDRVGDAERQVMSAVQPIFALDNLAAGLARSR